MTGIKHLNDSCVDPCRFEFVLVAPTYAKSCGGNLRDDNTRVVARFEFVDLLGAAGGSQEVNDRKVVSRFRGIQLEFRLPSRLSRRSRGNLEGKAIKPRPAQDDQVMHLPGAEL